VRTVAEKLAGQAAVVQVNTEENPLLAARFGIHGIPVIVLIQKGRAIGEINGFRKPDAILTWYLNIIKSAP
jgi:thioredoxin 2